MNWLLPVFKKATRSQVSLNSIANLAGRLWSSILSLISVPIFLRYLGAEAYGLVGLYASIEVIFNFLDLGLSATVNREMARNIAMERPAKENKDLLKTFEVFYWIIGIVVAGLIAAFAGWISRNWVIIHELSAQQVQISIYMMAFMFAARWPLTLYTGVFRGLQKQVNLNLLSGIAVTIRVVLAILILIFISNDVTVFLFWQAVSCMIEILLLLIFAWGELNKSSKEKPRTNLKIVKRIWKFALSFNLVGVFGMILSSADRLIASKFVDLSEIGYYGVAATAAGALTLIAYSISTAIGPKFAGGIARNDQLAVFNDYHRCTRIINYFIFGFGSILILFPSAVLFWWTQDVNVVNHATLILVFLVSASLFNSMQNPGYSLLIAAGNTKVPLLCNLGNCIVFIPLLIVLVSRFGIISVALVWLMENIITFLVYALSVRNILGNESFFDSLKKDVMPYFAAGLFWFMSAKLISLSIENELIEFAVIILATMGYFISMAPRVLRDAVFTQKEVVY